MRYPNRKLINLSQEVKEMCEPYFKKLGLDHFNYIHRDTQGRVTYLCSNHNWLTHYLKKCYPKIGAFEQNIELSQYNWVLWNGLDADDRIITDSKEITGVKYGIAIVNKEEDGFGFYNIGTVSSNPGIVNKYINEISQYENFITEFQEKCNGLIRTAKKFKLDLKPGLRTNLTNKPGYHFGNLYFTQREFQCINYLVRGKTAGEIAIILNISKRTVETHIQNIKRKMNCFNQFRLGYLLGELGINFK